MPNETVTSVHPIGEEFAGLSSSLLDPITGAFYDRYSNQVFFIKGEQSDSIRKAKPLMDADRERCVATVLSAHLTCKQVSASQPVAL